MVAFIRELSLRLESRTSGFKREFLTEIIREVRAPGKKSRRGIGYLVACE
jgi:hypothetical protein